MQKKSARVLKNRLVCDKYNKIKIKISSKESNYERICLQQFIRNEVNFFIVLRQ